MTNTNPLTDRLQRIACERLDCFWEGPSEDLINEVIAHTIKETLTAFQGDPLGLYTVAHYKQESNDYMRGASDQFLADQKKIKDILTTLTSSNDTQA